jgi:hypothetical protein
MAAIAAPRNLLKVGILAGEMTSMEVLTLLLFSCMSALRLVYFWSKSVTVCGRQRTALLVSHASGRRLAHSLWAIGNQTCPNSGSATKLRVPHGEFGRAEGRTADPSATPDFLWNLVALAHSMRPSLRKGAHADLSSEAWQEIRVRSG